MGVARRAGLGCHSWKPRNSALPPPQSGFRGDAHVPRRRAAPCGAPRAGRGRLQRGARAWGAGPRRPPPASAALGYLAGQTRDGEGRAGHGARRRHPVRGWWRERAAGRSRGARTAGRGRPQPGAPRQGAAQGATQCLQHSSGRSPPVRPLRSAVGKTEARAPAAGSPAGARERAPRPSAFPGAALDEHPYLLNNPRGEAQKRPLAVEGNLGEIDLNTGDFSSSSPRKSVSAPPPPLRGLQPRMGSWAWALNCHGTPLAH